MILYLGKIILACCLLVLIWSCTDYSRDLGDGYTFVKTNSGNHVITRVLSDKKYPSIILHSDVTDYVYDDNYILGIRTQSKDEEAQYAEAFNQGSGYFVLEKHTGIVKTGLSEEEFDKIVAELRLFELAENINQEIERPS